LLHMILNKLEEEKVKVKVKKVVPSPSAAADKGAIVAAGTEEVNHAENASATTTTNNNNGDGGDAGPSSASWALCNPYKSCSNNQTELLRAAVTFLNEGKFCFVLFLCFSRTNERAERRLVR